MHSTKFRNLNTKTTKKNSEFKFLVQDKILEKKIYFSHIFRCSDLYVKVSLKSED